MSAELPDEKQRRILGRVDKGRFVGRAAELQTIVAHAEAADPRALFVLLAPSDGISELLRQSYDELFHKRGRTVPIYFSIPRGTTAVTAAIEFLNTFLSQYIAFRRNDVAGSLSSATLHELLELAPAADYDWVNRLVETFQRERFSNNDDALIRFCFTAPHRLPAESGNAFVMIDAIPQVIDGKLTEQIIQLLNHGRHSYVIAGLRRQIATYAHSECDPEKVRLLRLTRLSQEDGRLLISEVAQRQGVTVSDEVRDLMVQQFECSPLFITSFIQSARELQISLTSYLACQRLYVDEVMGGRLGRYFSTLLQDISGEPALEQKLIRLLYESSQSQARSSISGWQQALGLDNDKFERILNQLHVNEFLSRDGNTIQPAAGLLVWNDFLKSRYRLDVLNDARALVVAEFLTTSLKRAPQTMARHYRSKAAIGVRSTLEAFDHQLIPTILFDYARYRETHKGSPFEEIVAAVDADKDLIRLPQLVHLASCNSFTSNPPRIFENDRCAIAHGFSDAAYTDASEVVWLVAEIDSKLEATLDLTESWYEWLISVARESSFTAYQVWLIAREGFSEQACGYLSQKAIYSSSREQFDLLTAKVRDSSTVLKAQPNQNEFEMVVPMGGDNELIVAHAAEEIARRLRFRPDAVNQIKHAVVEAFINASEHSLSPDQRIYQRFRAEDDKLVITISSRGIVPVTTEARRGENAAPSLTEEASAQRRGFGLSLIRTLMDEVEWERVDDGTSLRMTKYLRA